MKKYYPGNVVQGKVVGIKPYGVFISLDEETIGLLHISEISDGFIDDINKFVRVGDVIETKILDMDYGENRAKLSLKALKKRARYRKHKSSLSDEKIDVEKEFFAIKVRMDDFISDAKERLGI
jgi:glucose-6-phosphate isomerase/general stress protein 13